MKKFLITILALVPLTLWAQDNTWEHPEEEEEGTKEETVNPDQKYLRGAVPLVDGKVVFSKTIEAPGKSAAQTFPGFPAKRRIRHLRTDGSRERGGWGFL